MKAVLLHPTAPPLGVEIATTFAEHAVGLQGRLNLPWNEGVLFIFQKPGLHHFTMEGTPLPLDMLFLDEEGMVLGILPDTVPFSKGPYRIGLRSKYVIETNAGWAKRYGVEPGDVFTYTPLGRAPGSHTSNTW